mgnify:CR=1 FL=1
MSPNMVGASLMMASMAAFTINDALLKMTDGALPLFQLLFLRGAITSLLIIGFGRHMGRISFDISRRDWGVIAVRSFAEVAAAYFFLSALFHMPLANVTAILQVLPLALTLVSAVILREAVGWRRMSAIVVGFVGVMLIVKPGADGFNIWSVYALIAVACVTLRDLSTRFLSPAAPSMTVTLVTALSVMSAAGLASLSAPWAPVTPQLGVLIAGSGVFVLGGYFFSIQVMRTGDVSFVAPFRYTSLIWALLLGWFIFGDWPGVLTMIGAAIVVGTGIFTLYRERKVKLSG